MRERAKRALTKTIPLVNTELTLFSFSFGSTQVLTYSLVGVKADVPPIVAELKSGDERKEVLAHRHESSTPPQPASPAAAQEVADAISAWGSNDSPNTVLTELASTYLRVADFLPEGKSEYRWGDKAKASEEELQEAKILQKAAKAEIKLSNLQITHHKGDNPDKLVVVFEHYYTPTSLKQQGIDALKGRDRSVAELLLAARHKKPSTEQKSKVPSLMSLAAVAAIESPAFATVSKVDIVAGIAEEAVCEGSFVAEPQFDVVLAMVITWDGGEATPDIPFHTTGGLLKLVPTDADPTSYLEDLGERKTADIVHPFEHPSRSDKSMPHGGTDPFCGLCLGGNHSLVLDLPEFLLSKEQSLEMRKKGDDHGILAHADELEFLGNGMPYMGQVYSRAALVFWPKKSRSAVAQRVTGETEFYPEPLWGDNDY